ncbi:cell wall-binding repeat-containing protein, partial [Pseudoalteromonas sp. BZP1]|uniref:cell wall-binding repeat-containing protein n=1 Tax=Pseudoalteromonas sp. BZP1 TaxID=3136671 RepID=UPI0032C4322D
MDFEGESEPKVDTTAPNEISELKVTELSPNGVKFNYALPSDYDFEKVVVYKNGSKVSELKQNVFLESGLEAGKSYTYKFVTVDASGNTSNGVSKSITTPSNPVDPEPEEDQKLSFKRIAGDDRYSTSKAFSQEIPANSLDTVLLSSGNDFPDALAGGVLNKTLNGIVLLVRDNQSVINEQLNEAKRVLKDEGKIVILGGKSAVSQNIEEAFGEEFPVERIGGLNRFETAINIAEKVNKSPEEVVLKYGLNFADALSIVPYATVNEVPILLHSNGDSLQEDVLEYIKNKSSVKKVTIIGGTGVVPTSIEDELEHLGIQTINR